MKLQIILVLHAVVTFAAGVVLIVAPGLIPSTVNINLGKDQYLLCYFLAAAEIAIAYLSFACRKVGDVQTLKIILTTFIIFHSLTGLLELYAYTQGASPKILGNIVLRILIVIVFSYFGYYKKTGFKPSVHPPTP